MAPFALFRDHSSQVRMSPSRIGTAREYPLLVSSPFSVMNPCSQSIWSNSKAAAIYLGRSEQSVQHLIFQKELPVVRLGRRVHLDRRDLDRWIEKNKY